MDQNLNSTTAQASSPQEPVPSTIADREEGRDEVGKPITPDHCTGAGQTKFTQSNPYFDYSQFKEEKNYGWI